MQCRVAEFGCALGYVCCCPVVLAHADRFELSLPLDLSAPECLTLNSLRGRALSVRCQIREFMFAPFLTLHLIVNGGGRPRTQLSDGIRIVIITIITNPYWRCALGGLPPYSDTIRANVTLDRSAVFFSYQPGINFLFFMDGSVTGSHLILRWWKSPPKGKMYLRCNR